MKRSQASKHFKIISMLLLVLCCVVLSPSKQLKPLQLRKKKNLLEFLPFIEEKMFDFDPKPRLQVIAENSF